jgi:ATP-dependent DNA helicase UvrD/PcrA
MAKQWSKYQQAILDCNINDPRNKFVLATAGSGKTTTIEACINDCPSDVSVLAAAFGRDIKKTLEERVGHLPNVTVKTLNGLGHQACSEAVRKYIKINKKKVENLLYYQVMNEPESKEERDLYYASRYIVCRLVGLLKANMNWEPTDSEINDLMEIHGILVPKSVKPAALMDLVKATYKLNWKKTLVMDYDDQISMPLYHKWPIPQFDRTYVDEAQDLTPAQIELTFKSCAGRAYYVGDRRQAIYLFRGADSKAVDNIIKRMDCDVLPLSISYRCSKAVVRCAQRIAPEIEYHEAAPEGLEAEIKMEDFFKTVQDGDFVLCRTTAPVVSACMRLIRDGRKATVRGREIGDSLVEFINAVGYTGNDIEGFTTALIGFYGEQQEKLQRGGREDALILLSDQYETVRCLMEACTSVAGLIPRINMIFEDEEKPGVQCMTIHKSKGLESNRVFVLKPEQMPHKLAKTEEQLLAEENLKFVCITRAKSDIYWVQS